MTCQQHAGILDANEKLTKKAKDLFIDDVVRELSMGSPSVNLCGDSLLPMPFAEFFDLYDEQKYPDWHATWPPTYEKIAKALNVKGGFPFKPILDITALLFFAFPDIDLPPIPFPPDLGVPPVLPPFLIKLLKPKIPDIEIKLPDILANLPGLEIPKIPKFPELPLPLMVDLSFSLNALLTLPGLLFPPSLDLVYKIPSPPDFFLELCKIVKKQCFPPLPNAIGAEWTYMATTNVLARKCVECVGIMFAACTIGSSPIGAVGMLGASRGYKSPPGSPPPPVKSASVVDKIIDAAESGAGLHSSRNPVHAEILRQYADFLFPDTADRMNDQHVAVVKWPGFSSCGMFMRAVYRQAAGGDIGDSNIDSPYIARTKQSGGGPVISDIVQRAKKVGALKYSPETSKNVNLMELDLKRGDGIVITVPSTSSKSGVDSLMTHVLIIGEDLGQSTSKTLPERNKNFVSYEGGAPNVSRDSPNGKDSDGNQIVGGQRIVKGRYTFLQQSFGDRNDQPIRVYPSNKIVYYVIDGEKFVVG